MLSILAITILFGIAAGIIWRDEWSVAEPVAIAMFIGVWVGLFVSLTIGSHLAVHDDNKIEKVVALQDQVGTAGGMFLGTGYVDDQLKYFYYARAGEGVEARNQEADTVRVLEDNPSEPYFLNYNTSFNKRWHSFWFINTKDPGDYTKRSEFHIPKGSVKNGYTLDLGASAK